MSWIDKCIGKAWSYIARESPFSSETVSGTTASGREKKEPTLTNSTNEEPLLSGELEEEPSDTEQTKSEPLPTNVDWSAVESKIKAKVRAFVPKTVVESLHDTRVESASLDFEAIQQAAANRLFADALYDILKSQAEPPFDPSEQVMQWAEAALEEAVQDWLESGHVVGELSEGRSAMVDAIAASLKRASGNQVLKQAAVRRLEEEAAANVDG